MHVFQRNITHIPLPERFTYPFNYTPHPLCIQAAEEVQAYLSTQADWHEELQKGKMFGVLIVQDSEKQIGYLAAFSGLLAGTNRHDYFVPPIFDLLNPSGYFIQEEKEISGITRRIHNLKESPEFIKANHTLELLREQSQRELKQANEAMLEAKGKREHRRKTEELDHETIEAMIKESQFQKAEYKRLGKKWQTTLAEAAQVVEKMNQNIQHWKDERKKRSAALQQWLFRQYILLNAKGETRNISRIFEQTQQKTPPGGTGECAAPKLLQYAYQHGLQPLAMAEFWWGDSPTGEIRHHGYFYPACKQKCEPILNYMMLGLNIDPNPLQKESGSSDNLKTIYEDEYIVVVEKPAGMLSVPGLFHGKTSVLDILQMRYPNATGPLLIHRLDMDTSGLLLAAKQKEIHAILQEQIENRKIKKRYIALLNGISAQEENTGLIRLPLRPDYDNRPYQLVDYEYGKPAITQYEEIGHQFLKLNNETRVCTRVVYYPITGRTHQLRVHSAHPDGMNLPIVGDPLYGQPADRLYLHAEQLEFHHPVTGELLRLKSEAPF